jgi:hypothetical protein
LDVSDRSLSVLRAYLAVRQREEEHEGDPVQIYFLMRRELEGLRRQELLAAAEAAKRIGSEIRKIGWALGVKSTAE